MLNLILKLLDILPDGFKNTLYLRAYGLFKIPLLFFIRPSVIRLDDEVCTIKIPLKRRNKNHLNSMYFGVLACGADCAGGLSAMKQIHLSGKSASLAFKDFDAKFLKRAEGDTYFTCSQGREISDFVQKVVSSGERLNMPVKVKATCPDKLGDEPVAEFILTLSLKAKAINS
ncbi:MAG: DUF4442 domain-containing protein [Pseudomonadales bacterium]|nr:DUF4442 domain-containing protein [Pseudomonadales bacterium]